MTAAYAAFANHGFVPRPLLIRRVEERDGSVLYESHTSSSRAISDTTAFLMTTMLADVINAGTGAARASSGSRCRRRGRPARPTISTTRGSSASRRSSWPACGSASISRARFCPNGFRRRHRRAGLGEVHEGRDARRQARVDRATRRHHDGKRVPHVGQAGDRKLSGRRGRQQGRRARTSLDGLHGVFRARHGAHNLLRPASAARRDDEDCGLSRQAAATGARAGDDHHRPRPPAIHAATTATGTQAGARRTPPLNRARKRGLLVEDLFGRGRNDDTEKATTLRTPEKERRLARDTMPPNAQPCLFETSSVTVAWSDLLARSIASESLPPSLIFAGPAGIAKRQTALAVAQALNCLDLRLATDASRQTMTDACGVCAACARASRAASIPTSSSSNPATPARSRSIRCATSSIARRTARSRAGAASSSSTRPTRWWPPAQNALLKTLEEPPSSVGVHPRHRAARHAAAHRALAVHPAVVHEARRARRGRRRGDRRRQRALAHASATVNARRRIEERRRRTCSKAKTGAGGAVDRDQLTAHLLAMASLVRDIEVLATGADPAALANPDAKPALDRLVPAFKGERAVKAFSAPSTARSWRSTATRA